MTPEQAALAIQMAKQRALAKSRPAKMVGDIGGMLPAFGQQLTQTAQEIAQRNLENKAREAKIALDAEELGIKRQAAEREGDKLSRQATEDYIKAGAMGYADYLKDPEATMNNVRAHVKGLAPQGTPDHLVEAWAQQALRTSKQYYDEEMKRAADLENARLTTRQKEEAIKLAPIEAEKATVDLGTAKSRATIAEADVADIGIDREIKNARLAIMQAEKAAKESEDPNAKRLMQQLSVIRSEIAAVNAGAFATAEGRQRLGELQSATRKIMQQLTAPRTRTLEFNYTKDGAPQTQTMDLDYSLDDDGMSYAPAADMTPATRDIRAGVAESNKVLGGANVSPSGRLSGDIYGSLTPAQQAKVDALVDDDPSEQEVIDVLKRLNFWR